MESRIGSDPRVAYRSIRSIAWLNGTVTVLALGATIWAGWRHRVEGCTEWLVVSGFFLALTVIAVVRMRRARELACPIELFPRH